MTFHPAEFFHRTGISEAVRSMAVIGGFVLAVMGGMFAVVAASALEGGGGLAMVGKVLALLLSVGFLAGGLALVWRGISGVRERREIALTGTATMGKVVRVETTPLSINDVVQLTVRFTYRDADGQQHESVSMPLPPRDARAWSEGDEGHVRYHPVHPARAVWIGRSSLDAPPKKGRRR